VKEILKKVLSQGYPSLKEQARDKRVLCKGELVGSMIPLEKGILAISIYSSGMKILRMEAS